MRSLTRLKLFPMFYNDVKCVVEAFDNRQYRARHYIITVGFFLFMVRCVLYSVAIYIDYNEWQQNELFLSILNRKNSLNSTIYNCLALFIMFISYANYKLHFTPVDDCVWQLIYDLIVRNYRQFFLEQTNRPMAHMERSAEGWSQDSLSKSFPPKVATKKKTVRQWLKQVMLVFKSLWFGDTNRFTTKLPYFPNISIQIRSKVLLQHFFIEIVYTIFIIFYSKLLFHSNCKTKFKLKKLI